MPLDMQASTSAAMSSASSPEEAYKIFAGAATQYIGDAVAKAMADAIGAASTVSATAANPAIVGWEKFFTGATIALNWGTPGFRSAPSIVNAFSTSTVQDPAAPAHIQGVGFSIGITGTF